MDESKVDNPTESQSQPDVNSNTKVDTKSKDKQQSKEIAQYTPNSDISKLNLFNSADMVSAKAFLSEIMKSAKGGITSVNDGLAVLMRAKDLNLPFSTCIEHIHVINGKTGVDIHIVKALLSRAGCYWNCLKDYQPLYEYTDGINVYVDGSFPDYVERCKDQVEATEKAKIDTKKDIIYIYPVKWYKGNDGNTYRDYQLNTTRFGIAVNRADIETITKSNKIAVWRIPNVAVDYITEYEIFRPKGERIDKAKGRFSFSEATVAGMFEKDTYKKYARILIGHRAFTYAAREVASDILFGVMETTELKIVAGAELKGNDFGSTEDVDHIVIG